MDKCRAIASLDLLTACQSFYAFEPPGYLSWSFVLGCYVMAAGCLFWGVKAAYGEGSSQGRWRPVWGEIGLFAFFFAFYWLLESWMNARAPYYIYSTTLPDLFPHFPFPERELPDGELTGALVRELTPYTNRQISLSIPLLEASLT